MCLDSLFGESHTTGISYLGRKRVRLAHIGTKTGEGYYVQISVHLESGIFKIRFSLFMAVICFKNSRLVQFGASLTFKCLRRSASARSYACYILVITIITIEARVLRHIIDTLKDLPINTINRSPRLPNFLTH